MGWTPLRDGEAPNHLIQMARLLRDFGMWDLLGQTTRLPPPASKSAIENLQEIEISASDSKQCPVCLKDFETGIFAKRMPCKHIFSSRMYNTVVRKDKFVVRSARYQLPTDDEDYEMYRKEKQRAIDREKDLETLHNSMFL